MQLPPHAIIMLDNQMTPEQALEKCSVSNQDIFFLRN